MSRGVWGKAGRGIRCYAIGLLPRLRLQEACAALSSLKGLAGSMWSACQGSLARADSPHRWHSMAVSLICFALRL